MARSSSTLDELWTAAECRALSEEALSYARADETEVTLVESDVAELRFARNAPTTNGSVRTRTIRVRSSFGTRSATAQGNQLDRESLIALVRRAEELARRAPEDSEFVPALPPQAYVPVAEPAEEPGTFGLLVEGVRAALAESRALGLSAAGFADCVTSAHAIANSTGLFGYQRTRRAQLSQTARTSDGRGSGWASAAARRAGELDFALVARSAAEKARASADARPLATGSYPAVLEPDCVASLLRLFVQGLDARRADEGRSFFSRPDGGTKVGEALFPEWVRLSSDPASVRVPTLPWGADGLPHRATDWVRAGTVANLTATRYWAAKSERPPLAAPPNLLFEDAPSEANGAAGAKRVEDLVRSLDRGVLITNLWYIRSVDPRTLLFTGLTRDGVFWVEQGEVRHPVTNFRWNESPVKVLQHALERSRAVRTGGRGGDNQDCVVPALLVSEFPLTSVSDAV